MWKLWLDDQIDDPDCPARHTPEGFRGARSTAEAIRLVTELGPPGFIDFDHDLGGHDTAMAFLRWLSMTHYDVVPSYRVHSANPVGRDNIVSFMTCWLRSV